MTQRVSLSLSESFAGNDGEGCADCGIRTHFSRSDCDMRTVSLSARYGWGN